LRDGALAALFGVPCSSVKSASASKNFGGGFEPKEKHRDDPVKGKAATVVVVVVVAEVGQRPTY
jgi:hypothetical protein